MAQKNILQSGPRDPAPNSSGMALLLCLLMITTLCLVGGAALSVSGLNQKIVHNGAKQIQAFYLAEAGKELARSYLQDDPLWRGTGGTPVSEFSGKLAVNGREGFFNVTLSDCTADDNGMFNPLIPAGHILVKSTGTWMDASQLVSCIVRFRPVESSTAAFPLAAVISSGTISGTLVTLDEMERENGLLLQDETVLPTANENALKALADMAFVSLDDESFDAALSGIGNFWRDAPADTRPYIFYVQDDLKITGNRQLHGVVVVAGSKVLLEEESGVQGVLYAPNATNVSVYNTGASGRTAVTGLLVAGSGGVTISGNPISAQCCPDYVVAFNFAAGSQVTIDVVSGSWATH